MSKQRQQYQREQAQTVVDQSVQCAGCRFFKGGGESTDLGECRRYPPMAGAKKVTPNGPLMSFPVVSLTDWCGEFQKQT